jgi:hypothetical protein
VGLKDCFVIYLVVKSIIILSIHFSYLNILFKKRIGANVDELVSGHYWHFFQLNIIRIWMAGIEKLTSYVSVHDRVFFVLNMYCPACNYSVKVTISF